MNPMVRRPFASTRKRYENASRLHPLRHRWYLRNRLYWPL